VSRSPHPLEAGYLRFRRLLHSSGNDFALYQVALGLGHREDAAKYLARSRNWRNHWNPDMEALGHKGFLGPRDEAGNFIAQDPLSCGGCYWANDCKYLVSQSPPLSLLS